MRLLTLILVILIAFIVPTAALANEPPEPEPPTWDKSSITVEAACVEGVPSFTIYNGGASMTGPTSWYLLDVDGGAADCAADVEAGYLDTGIIQLAEGQSVTLEFEPIDPPQRLCVAQRPEHPGTGWGSATIDDEAVKACVTAEDVTGEPGGLRWLFLPALGL